MVSSGLSSLDRTLGGKGYPDKSTILVVGPPGIGKEAVGYWFAASGLASNDFCLYITNLAVKEVLEDEKGFGIAGGGDSGLVWMAAEGSRLKCDIGDLVRLSAQIKEVLRSNSDKRMRIVTDILSPLLLLNPPETVYKFLTQLFAEMKQYDVVLLATLEDEMHQSQAVAAMEQKFDGVIELKLYDKGMRVVPLFRVRKMRGIPPQPGYYHFSFVEGKMEISEYAK